MRTTISKATAILAGVSALYFATTAPAQEERVTLRSAMEACDDKIDEDCIVRNFKDTLDASEIRGRIVYGHYCVLCHGDKGKGDGRAARLQNPPPYDLTKSVAPRDYIAQVVRRGGEAMGRGAGMPPWDAQLTDEQTNDVLNYLMSIREYQE